MTRKQTNKELQVCKNKIKHEVYSWYYTITFVIFVLMIKIWSGFSKQILEGKPRFRGCFFIT